MHLKSTCPPPRSAPQSASTGESKTEAITSAMSASSKTTAALENKPGHFARFRTFALNILRANGTSNVSRELYLNALNPHHALAYRTT